MTEIAISTIQEFIKEHLFDPQGSWDKYEFEKRSYSQWAAYEIIERLMDHPHEMPICIIELFIFEMAMYAFRGEDEHRSFIFQTAVETAEEIILLFL